MDIETALGIFLVILVIAAFLAVTWNVIQKIRKMPIGKAITVAVILLLVPVATYAVVVVWSWYDNWSEAYEIEQRATTRCVGKVILDTGLDERSIEVSDISKVDKYVVSIDGSIPGHTWSCSPDVAGQPVVLYDPILR